MGKNETLADILAEIRDCAERSDNGGVHPDGEDLRLYADRIEAAHSREIDGAPDGGAKRCPTTPLTLDEAINHCDECTDDTPCGQQHRQLGGWLRELRELRKPGNTAAMRGALEDVLDRIDEWRTDGTLEQWQYSQLFDICDAALAASARNCDRFASWEEAKSALWEEFGDPCDWRKLGAWLFAKTEKERGGNGEGA